MLGYAWKEKRALKGRFFSRKYITDPNSPSFNSIIFAFRRIFLLESLTIFYERERERDACSEKECIFSKEFAEFCFSSWPAIITIKRPAKTSDAKKMYSTYHSKSSFLPFQLAFS